MTKNEAELIKESMLVIMEGWIKTWGNIREEDLVQAFPMMISGDLESIRKGIYPLPYSGVANKYKGKV